MATVSVSLPVYNSHTSFGAWKKRFFGYCALLKLSDAEQLQLLPLCFVEKKYDAIFENVDDRSTVNSICDKLDSFLRQESRPADPLMNLIECVWQDHETSYEYIRELRKRASFITTSKQAVDDMVRAQLIRSLPLGLSSMVAAATTSNIDQIANTLAQVPRRSVSPQIAAISAVQRKAREITCYNCATPGHTSRRCDNHKVTCSKCNRRGHLVQFCEKVGTQRTVFKMDPKNAPTGSSA